MKFILGFILIVAVLAFGLLVDRMPSEPPSFPSRDPLPPGMTNPPLRQIGDSIPPEGARVWFDTNSQHSFTILDTKDPAVYPVRYRGGLESTVNAAHISRLFIEAKGEE